MSRAYGGHHLDEDVEQAATIKANTGACFDYESETFVAHTLRGEGFDASEDGTGRGVPLVMSGRWRGDDGRGHDRPPHVSALASLDCHKVETVATVALRGRQGGGRAELGGEVATALRASQGGGDKAHCLAGAMVRRLTPRECERLQGLPDDYTLLLGWRPWRPLEDHEALGNLPGPLRFGKSEIRVKDPNYCPDSPRYKICGNAWARPVALWVCGRIQMVDDLLGADFYE